MAIVVAASIASHIVTREKLPAGLATDAWDPMSKDRVHFYCHHARAGHLMSLLKCWPGFRLCRGAVRRVAASCQRKPPWGATLAVITGRESEALFDKLVYLRRTGFAVA